MTGSGSGRQCPRLDAVRSFVKHDLPHLQIDDAHCRCFCVECYKSRGDRPTTAYRRGKFPYVLPAGFAKVALRLQPVQVENLKTWAPAFHGTRVESAGAILSAKNGHYLLLNPGDVLPEGDALGVREGHIKGGFNRMNEHAKQEEHFDPTNKVFMSPSIRYATHHAYSPPNGETAKLRVTDPTHPGNSVEVSASIKVALDVRLDPGEIRPGFGIGQETVGATRGGHRIDPVLPNECLEYYTDRRQTHFVAALMVRIVSVEDSAWKDLVMNVPKISACLPPKSAPLPPVGFIEEPRDPDPEDSRDPEPEEEQESLLFKAMRGGGAVAVKNMTTKEVSLKRLWQSPLLSTSEKIVVLSDGSLVKISVTGSSSALGGACVGAMSLPIGLACDGVRCAFGGGPKDMRKQFKTRLKNTPSQMVASGVGGAIGTAICPGVGTQAGMFCGSVISALVFEEATE